MITVSIVLIVIDQLGKTMLSMSNIGNSLLEGLFIIVGDEWRTPAVKVI